MELIVTFMMTSRVLGSDGKQIVACMVAYFKDIKVGVE